ncbi:MAG TPA: hypothetical protein VFO76_05070 [Candidatus Kapabacteria bacterium]|nr:hypothetical protein [Candidatus Kapabacteria bacterium]
MVVAAYTPAITSIGTAPDKNSLHANKLPLDMNSIKKNYLQAILASAVLLFAACKTLGIDPTFTFFIDKSFDFTVPTVVPVGQMFTTPGIPLALSDDELKSHNTELKYLKSAKITKLDLISSDPTNYPASSFDTLAIYMQTNTLAKVKLATYVGALDSTILSYVDILPYVKDSTNTAVLEFKANKAPKNDTKFTVNYRITFTADPIP